MRVQLVVRIDRRIAEIESEITQLRGARAALTGRRETADVIEKRRAAGRAGARARWKGGREERQRLAKPSSARERRAGSIPAPSVRRSA